MPYSEDVKDGLVQPEDDERHEMEDWGFDPSSPEDRIKWRRGGARLAAERDRYGDLLMAEREIEARHRAIAESFPGDIATSLADSWDHALDRQGW